MKINSLIILLFLTINLYADKNWIKIEPVNKTKTSKENTKQEPINKMIKNVGVIKQLLDSTGKKDKVSKDEKNWFALNNEEK